jgi:uncharacterized protein YggE
MTIWRNVALVTLAAALALFASAAEPDTAHGLAAQLKAEGITVTGMGVVRTVPDRAEITFGVVTQGRTASQALSANDAAIERVVAALRRAGIAAADIQTRSFSVSPRYDEAGTEIVGYTAENTVAIQLRDLERAGAVIDAAVGAGANQVFGPSLSRSDSNQLYRNALRAGVADARAKAQEIASAAGVSLGAVVGVVEQGASPEPPQPAADARAGAPIQPGTQDIQASVVVTFAAT